MSVARVLLSHLGYGKRRWRCVVYSGRRLERLAARSRLFPEAGVFFESMLGVASMVRALGVPLGKGFATGWYLSRGPGGLRGRRFQRD